MDKKTWEGFLEDARGFHKTVRGGLQRPEVFTAGLIQNIAAMGIERYFMALFTGRDTLPWNHTMGDLLETARTLVVVPDDLAETLLYFDSLQSICSVYDFTIIEPKPEDVPRFVDAIDRVAVLVEENLRDHSPSSESAMGRGEAFSPSTLESSSSSSRPRCESFSGTRTINLM